MARINQAGSGYTAPSPIGVFQWLCFDKTRSKQKAILQEALNMLRNSVRGSQRCNNCFKRLPSGKTFDSILDDNNVWISYSPLMTHYGGAIVNGKDVTICQLAFDAGVFTVAGTLVHEFAHLNGASPTTHDAEATLPSCGFGKIYDKTIIGTRDVPLLKIS